MRGKRRETTRDCRGTSSAPHLANSSVTSFPGRKECPETHCSLIVKKEREDSSCQICHRVCDKKERVISTERESKRRKQKWQICWCCHDQRRTFRMAQAYAEKLAQTGPTKKKESLPCRKVSNWQLRQNRLCNKKKKKHSHQFRSLDREVGRSPDEQMPHLGKKDNCTLARKREIRGKHGTLRLDCTVEKNRLQEPESKQE